MEVGSWKLEVGRLHSLVGSGNSYDISQQFSGKDILLLPVNPGWTIANFHNLIIRRNEARGARAFWRALG